MKIERMVFRDMCSECGELFHPDMTTPTKDGRILCWKCHYIESEAGRKDI